MRYTTDANNENIEVGTIFNSLYNYLGTSVLFVYVSLLILFHMSFFNPICSADHLNKAH